MFTETVGKAAPTSAECKPEITGPPEIFTKVCEFIDVSVDTPDVKSGAGAIIRMTILSLMSLLSALYLY